MKTLSILSNTIGVLPARNNSLGQIALCGDGTHDATLELFDGSFGTIATKAIAAGGTLYLVGDTITLVAASGGVQAVFTVSSVDNIITGVITGLTLVSGGTGYVAGSTYATTTNSVAGSGATVTASTVTDSGTLIAKLGALQDTNADPYDFEESLFENAISCRLTGTGAVGHLSYC